MKIKEDILNILDSCTVEGNLVRLPDSQLDRKTYLEVNKCLESIGGKWNKKLKGHLLAEDAAQLLDNLILTGETVDLKKEYQYFPTPKPIVKDMVEWVDIKPKDIILEPSAGQGAIADMLPKDNSKVLVELNESNVKALKDKGYDVISGDFLGVKDIKADKIVMNPPFSGQQDIEHILHAYNLLNKGGRMVSVSSEGPFFRQNKKSVAFREFLNQVGAEVLPLDEGAFKESGTMIRTRIIRIEK